MERAVEHAMTSDEAAAAPTSTYRVQFTPEFGFAAATEIVAYLAELGIGAIYASPYLRARQGSRHGYDVLDHNALNPEIGTPEEYEAFIRASQDRGIAHILDFVPNHMAVAGLMNPWWGDVLEWGERSPYAKFFDIDWHSERPVTDGKLLLPFLGDQYSRILERGELVLGYSQERGAFDIGYFERRFPLAPSTYAPILATAATFATDGARAKLNELERGFETLGGAAGRSEPIERLQARARLQKERLRDLSLNDRDAAQALERAVRAWSARADDPASVERLDDLLACQHYRLASWRVSLHEINYRRFFDINDLAGLRVEEADVLARSHQLLFDLIARGRVQGLRIDHVDGLFNPAAYCRLLRERAAVLSQPLYIVVEKILARFEPLREDWGVDGTVGYDFLNAVNGLFVNPRAEGAFDRIYAEFAASQESYERIAYESKLHIIYHRLGSELTVLANRLYRIAHADRRSADLTYEGIRTAIAHTVAAFPVYRTYITAEGASDEDRRFVEWAITLARKRTEIIGESTFEFIMSALTTDAASAPSVRYDRKHIVDFAMRFQQYTSPVTAKGLEDTAFYRYVRLLSLNEVGGDPDRFGTPVAAFHRHNKHRAAKFPYTMLATATHDHKRGEDTRLRIDSLSEMPGRWQRAVRLFTRLAKRRGYVDNEPAPARNDEYALYQMIVGTWPAQWIESDPPPEQIRAYVERIEQWLLKAVREANLRSNWVRPNQAYEEAALDFARKLFDEPKRSVFLRELRALAADAAVVAMVSSLSQTTLKLASPGVPDVYQGCELWDFSMVDPDNRRPVDFALRRRLLTGVREGFERCEPPEPCTELLRAWPDGRVKLFVLWRLLQLRKANPKAFAGGTYRRLLTGGRRADRLVAFARDQILVVVPRLVYPLLRVGEDGVPALSFTNESVTLPSKAPRRYVNAFTRKKIEVAEKASRPRLNVSEILNDFPVAVLIPA
jgi:(1->4)-alpha-D-glucan 1-alpha-D-glucosylmutase